MLEKYFPYIGDIQAITAEKSLLHFVSKHAEQHNTALYQLDIDSGLFTQSALPCGANTLLMANGNTWIAGTDQQLYRHHNDKISPFGDVFDGAICALALLSQQRLAVLVSDKVHILSTETGKQDHSLTLTEQGTALASDSTGEWLVVGGNKGAISVFECEDKKQFLLSETASLHNSKVTQLIFSSQELRFFSTGQDGQLLSTFARGQLEPEDRGRGANHSDTVSALILGPGERLYSASRDKSCKNWATNNATKPATLTRGLQSIIDITIVEHLQRPHLVAVCKDNSLRLFALDAAGKFGDPTHRLYDAYQLAEQDLQASPSQRETCLQQLATYADNTSLKLLANQVIQDNDFSLRQLATELIAKTAHPTAINLLKPLFKNKDEAVRLAAFNGLCELHDDEFAAIDLAISSEKENIASLAVAQLEIKAQKDHLAMQRLTMALNANPFAVRCAALSALERLDPENANVTALQSKRHDIRRVSLIQMYRHDLLGKPLIQTTLRRCLDNSSSEVREAAFLISLLSNVTLSDAIRARDKDIHRLLFEIETFTLPNEPKHKKADAALPKIRKIETQLESTDYQTLLQATASQNLDTCLYGARCLALLNDNRALALLLQLSREQDKQARVKVCRALGELNEPRALHRLQTLQNDKAPEVRDAAFTAISLLHNKTPLAAAEIGLKAQQEDVRQRALQLLVGQTKKKAPKKATDQAWKLMHHALNDAATRVRSEAFKAILNQQIGGDEEQALRFALCSIHSDIRREVQSELMGQANQPWAWQLLLSLFNDAQASIRKETFEFVVRKTKSRDIDAIGCALSSEHKDVQILAIEALSKKPSEQAQTYLVNACSNIDNAIRTLAISKVCALSNHKQLLAIMKGNNYQEVRLQAAQSLALLGDNQAYKLLIETVQLQKPEEKSLQANWEKSVIKALDGLAILADPRCFTDIAILLKSDNKAICKATVLVYVWCQFEQHGPLEAVLQHQDKEIKYLAALALALNDHAAASQIVLSTQAKDYIANEMLMAVALRHDQQDFLINLLDSNDSVVRLQALMLLLMQEFKNQDREVSSAILSCLSAENAQIRLIAADALQNINQLKDIIRAIPNRIKQQEFWTIDNDTLSQLMDLLLFGNGTETARSMFLLKEMFAPTNDKWADKWAYVSWSLKKTLATLAKNKKLHQDPAKEVETQGLSEYIAQLAFGTYIGLVREGGQNDIRLNAVKQLSAIMNESGNDVFDAASPVLTQAMSDTDQRVRETAFNTLKAIQKQPALLAQEALNAGYLDMGVVGLELLSQLGESNDILSQTMLNRDDDLAIEAAKLYRQAASKPDQVAQQALQAVYRHLRLQAVNWLIEDNSDLIIDGLQSRYPEVRDATAIALAQQQDTRAFDTLQHQLNKADAKHQSIYINALVTLNDDRAVDLFLQRIQQEQWQTGSIKALLHGVQKYRHVDCSEQLLSMMENSQWRKELAETLYIISGFDQHIYYNRPDEEWLIKQHPRQAILLLKLMERQLELGAINELPSYIEGAKWNPDHTLDSLLEKLATHSELKIAQTAVRALGWRLRKRSGPDAALVNAMAHKDDQVRFYAAESLAKAGRSQGLSVLLTSVELLSDIGLRERAVNALGQLADQRALDLLLRLANDSEHALHNEAAEALGHMAESEQAKQIFELLQRAISSDDWELRIHAIRGLRWYNSFDAWQLIRDAVNSDDDEDVQECALKMLAHNDDPATRTLLLKYLATPRYYNDDCTTAALKSAKKLFNDDLQPDYAFLKSGIEIDSDSDTLLLQRVVQDGEVSEIFNIYANAHQDVKLQLSSSLLARKKQALEPAVQALEGQQGDSVILAIKVLTYQHAEKPLSAKHSKACTLALQKWVQLWQTQQDKNQTDGETEHCLSSLIWCAGRLIVAQDTLLELLKDEQQRLSIDLRRTIIDALIDSALNSTPDNALLQTLQAAMHDNDATIRLSVASTLAKISPDTQTTLAEQSLSDHLTFNRLNAQSNIHLTQDSLLSALNNAHQQPIAMSKIVNMDKAEKHLAQVVTDKNSDEYTRLGALEGLAACLSSEAQKLLIKLGKDKALDEELRKTAWNHLRRNKRLLAKRADQQNTGSTL